MDKIARRVAHARRHAARSSEFQAKREQQTIKWRSLGNTIQGIRGIAKNIKDSRKALKEDWEMGPLAPKRDLGFNQYGVITDNIRIDWSENGDNYLQSKIAAKRCAWAGGIHQLNLAVGDRVVILDGHDKGKIDKIESIHASHGFVKLEKHHRALTGNPVDDNIRSTPMPISVDSIRLVYPLPDPSTGVTRDTIIRELRPVKANMQSDNMNLERWRYGNKWDRVVPSLNVTIPWPETVPPEFATHASDTARDIVEERTFHYGLTSAPMPAGVLDELRNKYSKFRTRHDAWYVEKKEAEVAARERAKEMIHTMRSPVQEFNEQQRAIRDAAGKPTLTDDMLAKIGEIMAKNNAAGLGKGGVSETASKK